MSRTQSATAASSPAIAAPSPATAALRPLALIGVLTAALAAVDDPQQWSFADDIKPHLVRHCGECHGEKKQKGDIDLSKFQGIDDVQRAAGTWEQVLRVLRDGEMPPASAPQPPAEVRERLVAWAEYALDNVDPAKQVRDPGHVLLHRLSRSEYNNTIRDLLGVDTRPADQFPVDGGGGGGFDNNADTLFIPPLLLEKLVEAADSVLAAAKPERLFTAKPVDDKPKSRREAAKTIATAFAARAYRRPASPMEVSRLLKVFDYCEKKGIPYEDGIRQMLKAALMSPSFLFRVEDAKAGAGAYALGHYEMASRLSYFLWSTMPDDALFALAEQKQLQDPAVIAQQVARMLADPRSMALSESFTTQWLQIDQLRNGAAGPDPQRFPEFTPALRDAMCGEPVAFMAGLIRDNRSIIELIDSDYTFVNGELARFYGFGGAGGGFQQVKLPDANRGGVLGMAAVLTATSHPLRTSPVLRGKWVLSQLLDAPPPPPPPNVASLAKEDDADEGLSLRKRLEQHRRDVNCAACHARIDPLGFGLENFGVLGGWRAKDARGELIDNSGTLPNGAAFAGPAGLRKVLLERKEQFTRAFTGKLLAYALGRGMEPFDRVVLKEISDAVAKDGYRMRTLITAIATSHPFRHARVRPITAKPAKPDHPAAKEEKK